MKQFFSILFLTFCVVSQAQYVGVKARYTDTRLIPNPGFPPSRENKLVLSFFDVDPSGHYSRTEFSNVDVWIQKSGLQYGSATGSVMDSAGNNYPGYTTTAPKVVAYHNGYAPSYIGCEPYLTTHYYLTGRELDCGWIEVSHWENDPAEVGAMREIFTAPNVCLPYYFTDYPASEPIPYPWTQNWNFSWPVPATAPHNYYLNVCNDTLEKYYVVRGVLKADTVSGFMVLATHLTNEQAVLSADRRVTLSWTNSTESHLRYYDLQRSVDGGAFVSIRQLVPVRNDGQPADYVVEDMVLQGSVLRYRIVAVEENEVAIYSKELLVRTAHLSPRVGVFPNPVLGGHTILSIGNLSKGLFQLQLVDYGGHTLYSTFLQHRGGLLKQELQLTGIVPGVYWLVVQSGRQQFTSKVVLQ